MNYFKYRVPTSTGKPGKSQKKVPCMEKSWNFKNTEKSWKNHGILFLNFCGNPVNTIYKTYVLCV